MRIQDFFQDFFLEPNFSSFLTIRVLVDHDTHTRSGMRTTRHTHGAHDTSHSRMHSYTGRHMNCEQVRTNFEQASTCLVKRSVWK